MNTWVYAIISTVIVSLISVSGIIFLSINSKQLQKIVFILVSLAVGAILGNVFFHLIPEIYEHEHHKNFQLYGILITIGILLFFVAEHIFHWHHHHVDVLPTIKPFGYINLIADGIHNFTDGILIAAAWSVDMSTGIATTTAVLIHEIPQEISDFGVLIHSGFTKKKALVWNFISALTAIVGTILTLWVGQNLQEVIQYIIPLAAGGFIYLACSDLIPELNKHTSKNNALIQIVTFFLGLLIMLLLAHNSH